MARLDAFDKDLAPSEWYDHCLLPEAWFDDDLILAGSAPVIVQGSAAAVLGDDIGQLAADLQSSSTVSSALTGDSAQISGATSTSGTVAALLGDDSAAASGTVGAAPANATISATLGDDSAQLSATVQSSASIAASLGDDSSALSATVSSSGAVASALSNDTSALSGAVANNATVTAIANNDAAAGTASLLSSGTVAALLGNDTAALSANLTIPAADATIAALAGDDGAAIAASTFGTAVSIGENTGQTPGVQDTLLRLAPGQDNTNFSSGLQLGASNFAVGDAATTVIRFDLSSIPAGAVIMSASVTFTLGNNSGTPTLGLQKAITNWNVAQATWNDSNTGAAWGAGGARLDGTDRVAASSSTVTLTSGQTGTITFGGLASDVQSMLSANNNGWQLDRVDGAFNDGQFCVLKSSEETDGLRPFLSVVYFVPVLGTVGAVLGDDSAQADATATTTPPPAITPPLSGGGGGGSYSSGFPSRRGSTPYVVADRKTIKIGGKTVPVQDLDENDEDLTIILSAIYAYRELT